MADSGEPVKTHDAAAAAASAPSHDARESGEHQTFDPAHLFGHVQDTEFLELPRGIVPGGHVELPQPLAGVAPLWSGNDYIAPFDFRFTKFMLIEAIVAVIMVLLFAWVAGSIARGKAVKGPIANMLEAMLLFIRERIAEPAIGHHHADHFLPYLWTAFFFILGCNLMGLVPWMGSPTGDISVTAVLAILTFVTVVWSGMNELGPMHWVMAQCPHMDLEGPMAYIIKPLVWSIEVMGLGIKHFVLSVRLFANIFAGHLVLSVIITFVVAIFRNTDYSILQYGVSWASVFGSVGLSMLELLVAFIQAFVFTFLSALFIGSSVHPH